VQGTYCGGWRRCACLDAKTRVLAVGVLVSTTYNNLTADLLPTREVPCTWTAPALAGWCCYSGVLPLAGLGLGIALYHLLSVFLAFTHSHHEALEWPVSP
jgi:hypothetical protein